MWGGPSSLEELGSDCYVVAVDSSIVYRLQAVHDDPSLLLTTTHAPPPLKMPEIDRTDINTFTSEKSTSDLFSKKHPNVRFTASRFRNFSLCTARRRACKGSKDR